MRRLTVSNSRTTRPRGVFCTKASDLPRNLSMLSKTGACCVRLSASNGRSSTRGAIAGAVTACYVRSLILKRRWHQTVRRSRRW